LSCSYRPGPLSTWIFRGLLAPAHPVISTVFNTKRKPDSPGHLLTGGLLSGWDEGGGGPCAGPCYLCLHTSCVAPEQELHRIDTRSGGLGRSFTIPSPAPRLRSSYCVCESSSVDCPRHYYWIPLLFACRFRALLAWGCTFLTSGLSPKCERTKVSVWCLPHSRRWCRTRSTKYLINKRQSRGRGFDSSDRVPRGQPLGCFGMPSRFLSFFAPCPSLFVFSMSILSRFVSS
jgi:hypothetical protein